MNKPTAFRTVLKNRSRFPIDIVWKNALDLEHVTILHSDTNAELHLLGTFPKGSEQYEVMIYRAKRKLLFFKINSFGFRQVQTKFNLQQVEYLPLLGTTIALNSILRQSDDTEFPTEMVDELIIECPWFLRPFKHLMERSLSRHARIQCSQDEPFRARMKELEDRGIDFKYRIFGLPAFDRLTSQFQESLS